MQTSTIDKQKETKVIKFLWSYFKKLKKNRHNGFNQETSFIWELLLKTLSESS